MKMLNSASGTLVIKQIIIEIFSRHNSTAILLEISTLG
jgi:hypothetical protein